MLAKGPGRRVAPEKSTLSIVIGLVTVVSIRYYIHVPCKYGGTFTHPKSQSRFRCNLLKTSRDANGAPNFTRASAFIPIIASQGQNMRGTEDAPPMETPVSVWTHSRIWLSLRLDKFLRQTLPMLWDQSAPSHMFKLGKAAYAAKCTARCQTFTPIAACFIGLWFFLLPCIREELSVL